MEEAKIISEEPAQESPTPAHHHVSKVLFWTIIAAVIVGAGLMSIFIYRNYGTTPSIVSLNENSSTEPTNEIITTLASLFAEKYNKPETGISVLIQQETAQHVVGSVRLSDQPGDDGLFYATNVAGVWKIVADGNGMIECSVLAEYEFPESMMNQCFDPMADWEMYRNDEYGFTIKYPSNWRVEDAGLQSDGIRSYSIVSPEPTAKRLIISPLGNPGIGLPFQGIEREEVIIDGLRAEKISASNDTLNICYIKLLEGPDNWAIADVESYAYNAFSSLSCEMFNDSEIQQILSTFEFIDSVETVTIKTYSSNKLGVSFDYSPDSQPIAVKEVGNKIYIGFTAPGSQDVSQFGQSVTVFTKDPRDTLEQTIAKQFLLGYDAEKCFVKKLGTSGFPANIETAIISFPPNEDPNEPWWDNNDCPTDYSESNGLRYFLIDKNHPSTLLFFEIGQYAIPGSTDGQKDWAHTLTIQ